MTMQDYETTKEVIRNLLYPFGPNEVKKANKAVKATFDSRLSQIKCDGGAYAYYIIVEDDDDDRYVAIYTWDFFYHDFM